MPEIYTFRALQLTRFVYTSYQPAALGPTVSGLVPVPGVAVAVGPYLLLVSAFPGGSHPQRRRGFSEMKMNLSKLMYAGYYGGSALKGVDPYSMEQALKSRFDVSCHRVGGVYDFELVCRQPSADGDGPIRLRVRYGWVGTGWQYQPVPARKNTRLPRSGDVVYGPDGGYRIAA